MALTFGRVPHPGFVDLQHTTAGKPEGVGWDNLGKRSPKFIALHRMVGTLRGTDQHFADPTVGALTDYGLGVEAVDGKARSGEIHKYNDPLGFRSGWASGRVSAPYGDGLAIVNTYGINAVNRDGVSIEIAGYRNEPLNAFEWGELVALCAYWVDWMKIPYTSLPRNPHTGINALIWHQEFTIGTGKECPFDWVMNNTNQLYADIAAYLKPYQEGNAGVEQPKPAPVVIPAPRYAAPAPIPALAKWADVDRNNIAAVVTDEANRFYLVKDRVRAIRDTPRLRYAMPTAERVGPNIRKGEEFDVTWIVRGGTDGQEYYITDWWSRILAKDTERVAD